MLAVLAEHGLVNHRYVFHIVQMTDIVFLCIGLAILFNGVIPVDTYPVHFPTATHFIAAYHRNIIFEITSYDTGTTTRTGIEVDSHHPFMARLLVLIPQIISFVCIGPPTGIVRRVFLILRETRFADDVTTFDGMV